MTTLPFADAAAFKTYFEGGTNTCGSCHAPIDWWRAATEWVAEKFAFGSVLMLAGASTTHSSFGVSPGEIVRVDLTQAGVPADADIVNLNFTGMGAMTPLLMHGNNVLRDPLPPVFNVLGRALPETVPVQSSNPTVLVSAVWFVRRPDDTAERHLVEAARHYEANRFDGVVVPANIAAEAAIGSIVRRALEGYASAKHLQSFLRDAATYSHQLNVLLTILADLRRVPRLPTVVRDALNGLRKLRNDIAHAGKCATQSQVQAAQHITAAIFGVRYATFFTELLADRVGTDRSA